MTVVRFAPSPTGFLHLGSARTALFNWLYARHTGGKFLLRIEDTDQTRSDKKFLAEILEDMKWMGLDWDAEPVYQSSRFDVYRKTAESLLSQGKAYREGDAIIFKVEKGRTIEVEDIIHGKIVFNTDEIKDQVMIKSDGSPAYNFCCVVDDAYLKITHIIRGDDHISNTPKQILLYEAMGAQLPKFAHMPLMMGSDGAQLSKRHGAVSVEEYRKEGFLPEALTNYLLLLGWSPGDDREMISQEEVIKLFDVKDMRDVQSRFDAQKLRWLNGEYIMKKETKELLPLIKKQLLTEGIDISGKKDEYLETLIDMYKIRIKTLKEFVELTDQFFVDKYTVDEKGKRKYLDKESNKQNINLFAERLEKLEKFNHETIESLCREIAEEKNFKAADIIHPTRMAISGKTRGAGLFEMMELLGKEKVIARLKKAAGN
ncbi:MAG: glutamate--tRNA ligase [Candidatus Omnitrophota bacterium]